MEFEIFLQSVTNPPTDVPPGIALKFHFKNSVLYHGVFISSMAIFLIKNE